MRRVAPPLPASSQSTFRGLWPRICCMFGSNSFSRLTLRNVRIRWLEPQFGTDNQLHVRFQAESEEAQQQSRSHRHCLIEPGSECLNFILVYKPSAHWASMACTPGTGPSAPCRVQRLPRRSGHIPILSLTKSLAGFQRKRKPSK